MYNYLDMMLTKYNKHLSESKFSSKLTGLAKRAGRKLLYPAMLLYNMYKSDKVSLKDKAIVVGALGYFILPGDLIADIIPILGFTDDIAVMTLAIRSLRKSITPEIKNAARQSVDKICPSKQ